MHFISKIRRAIKPSLYRQFGRYIVTGFLSFALEYGVFFILYRGFLSYLWSNSIAMIIAFLFNFFLNRFWSFQSKKNIYRQILQYGILFAVNINISNAMLYAFSYKLNISPLISKVFIMCIIVGWNFMIYRKIIYR